MSNKPTYIKKVRDYCKNTLNKEITCKELSKKTGISIKYCSTALCDMQKRGELEKIGVTNKTANAANIYKVKQLLNDKISFNNLAANFLNKQGKGFIFNLKELSNFVGCHKSTLKDFLIDHQKSNNLKALKEKRPYRYEVKKEILIPNKAVNERTNKNNKQKINEDNLYIFIYSGNLNVIKDNSLYSSFCYT